jgi:hypothetical protein
MNSIDCVIMLKKMLTYDTISEENKKRVTAAISELSSPSVAAAAGSRKQRKGRPCPL